MSDLSAFELASKIGEDWLGEIGRLGFEEIELSYASRKIGVFHDVPELRAWQNLLFYWLRSFFKSLMINVFFHRAIPPESPFFTVPINPDSWVDTTSATTETMFGSISRDGERLIWPMFYKKAFVVISELTAFFTPATRGEKAPMMNKAMEGEEVTRNLIKFGDASDELKKKYRRGYEGLCLRDGQLTYRPESCFICASHPLDNRTWTFLNNAPIFDRFHVLQINITQEMAKDIMKSEIKSPDAAMLAELRNLNSELRPKIVMKPSDAFMKPIIEKSFEVAEGLCEEFHKMEFLDIYNVRTLGNVIREVAAYRVLEPGRSDAEAEEWIIKRLPHFFEFITDPIIEGDRTTRIPKLDRCRMAIIREFGGRTVERKEVQERMQSKYGFGKTTIDKVLREFDSPAYGKYTIPKGGSYQFPLTKGG